MSTQNGSHLQIRNFDSRIRIKDTTLKSSPYVCIASHAFAMFAHKNFYGCAGYTYNPLLNIAVWMPACIIWLHYGKCLREKTFMNFVILQPPAKVSPRNFRHAISIHATFRDPQNVPFLPIRESFLP